MDFGDDPLLATQYASVNLRAAQSLQPAKVGMLEALKNRKVWSTQTLEKLRDQCITPDMLVTSGAKWSTLAGRWGTESLIDFGFGWPQMLAAGFRGQHLRTVSRPQLARLKLNASRILECKPSIGDISSMGLTASELRQAGWTTDLLCAVGLNMKTMVQFGFPLQQWIDTFQLQSLPQYGFHTYAECAQAGWSDPEIRLALSPSVPKLEHKSNKSNKSNGAGQPLVFQL